MDPAPATTGSRPVLTLNHGVEMPALGLGVFQSPPEQTIGAVEAAIAGGYRLIDTAAAYFNEREVGEGSGGAARPRRALRPDQAVDQRLRLRVGAPGLRCEPAQARARARGPLPAAPADAQRVGAHRGGVPGGGAAARRRARARDRCVQLQPQASGGARARTEVVPAVNQVELHPFFTQRELRAVHARLGIVTQAWSPLGGVNVYRRAGPEGGEEPARRIPSSSRSAKQYGKTPAQVVLRWHIEHGFSAIPKSVRPARIAENIEDLRLRADGRGGRGHRRAGHGRAGRARSRGYRHEALYQDHPGLKQALGKGTDGRWAPLACSWARTVGSSPAATSSWMLE